MHSSLIDSCVCNNSLGDVTLDLITLNDEERDDKASDEALNVLIFIFLRYTQDTWLALSKKTPEDFLSVEVEKRDTELMRSTQSERVRHWLRSWRKEHAISVQALLSRNKYYLLRLTPSYYYLPRNSE